MTLVTLDYLGPRSHVENLAQTNIGAKETIQTLADFELPGSLSNT